MERSCPNRRWDFGLLGSVAVHTILGTALLLIPWTRAQNPAESGAYAVAVVVPPTESSDNASGDHRLVDDPQDPIEVIEYADGPNRVPGLDFDIDKLRARREALFPFLTTDLGFLDRLSEQIRGGSSAPAIPQAVELKTSSTLPPLRLSDEALQQTIDRAWSRRSRWTAFAEIAELTRTHNSDSGQAPSVLSAYLDQNLLQLFCDTSTRVPRLWAMLENAADHIAFVDFVAEFTHDRPSSLATTELLFLLDKLAQASRDTLLLLLSIDAESELRSPGREDG